MAELDTADGVTIIRFDNAPVNALDLDLLEVIIPARTLKHRRQRKEPLNLDESDRLARVARLYELAVKVFGDADKARRWLSKPKERFQERSPVEMMRTELGGRQIEEMLYQIDEGVFA